MTLLDLDLGSIVALGTVAVGVVGWLIAQDRRINRKASSDDLKAAHEDGRQHCAQCRREVDAEMARRAGEVAEQRESIAVLRAELSALSRGIDSLRADVGRLADRLERWMEREQ